MVNNFLPLVYLIFEELKKMATSLYAASSIKLLSIKSL